MVPSFAVEGLNEGTGGNNHAVGVILCLEEKFPM